MRYRFVVEGKPVVLKNSKVIVPVGPKCKACKCAKRRAIVSNAKVKRWQRFAAAEIMEQYTAQGGAGPLLGPVEVAVLVGMPTKRKVDLDNALCAPLDALEDAGVIANDSQVVSVDGSRVRACSHRPHVEIWVKEVEVKT